MPGKRIHFHPELVTALKELADERMASLQELADEAFDDLLRKHGRPVGLRAMLKESADAPAARAKRGKARVPRR